MGFGDPHRATVEHSGRRSHLRAIERSILQLADPARLSVRKRVRYRTRPSTRARQGIFMHANWSRRRLLVTAAVVAPAVWRPRSLLAQPAPTTLTGTNPPYVEAETAQGRVRGGHSRGALAFKGIPYAGQVSGAARFKEAPP